MATPKSSDLGEVYAEKAERFLREFVSRHLDRVTVVLFGSRADGTYDRHSDFDIAYLPLEGFDPMNVVRLREDIERSNIIYGVDLSRVEELFREKSYRRAWFGKLDTASRAVEILERILEEPDSEIVRDATIQPSIASRLAGKLSKRISRKKRASFATHRRCVSGRRSRSA